MDNEPRSPDETLYAFVQRRERELMHQISALKSQTAAKETELAHVQSAVRQLASAGDAWPWNKPANVVPQPQVNALASIQVPTIPNNKVSTFETLKMPQFPTNALALASVEMAKVGATMQNALASAASAFESPTIKRLVLRALHDHFRPNGATASQLREYLKNAYGRDIAHNSISPQLSRLKADGSLTHDSKSDSWFITPQGDLIAIGHLPPGARIVPEQEALEASAENKSADASETPKGGTGPFKRRM